MCHSTYDVSFLYFHKKKQNDVSFCLLPPPGVSRKEMKTSFQKNITQREVCLVLPLCVRKRCGHQNTTQREFFFSPLCVGKRWWHQTITQREVCLVLPLCVRKRCGHQNATQRDNFCFPRCVRERDDDIRILRSAKYVFVSRCVWERDVGTSEYSVREVWIQDTQRVREVWIQDTDHSQRVYTVSHWNPYLESLTLTCNLWTHYTGQSERGVDTRYGSEWPSDENTWEFLSMLIHWGIAVCVAVCIAVCRSVSQCVAVKECRFIGTFAKYGWGHMYIWVDILEHICMCTHPHMHMRTYIHTSVRKYVLICPSRPWEHQQSLEHQQPRTHTHRHRHTPTHTHRPTQTQT